MLPVLEYARNNEFFSQFTTVSMVANIAEKLKAL